MSQEFCTNCGANLVSNAAFCTECGTPVPSTEPTGDLEVSTSPLGDASTNTGAADPSGSAFCTYCGAGLTADESFCTRCGKSASTDHWALPPGVEETAVLPPAVATPATSPAGPMDHRPIANWLWVAASMLVLTLGALGAWARLGNDDGAPTAEPVPPTLEAGDPGSSPETRTTGPSTASTASLDCSETAERLADEIRTWATSLEASGLTAEAPDTNVGSCDLDSTVRAAFGEIQGDIAVSTGLTRAAFLAFQIRPDAPSESLTSTLESYPTRPGFTPRDHQTPSWIVVLESLEAGQYTRSQAQSRADRYTGRFPNATVVLSDDYISLRPGYWAIVETGYSSFDSALDSCQGAGLGANECYPRLLQDVGNQTTLIGECGYFGQYTVDSGTAVQLHPRSSSAEVRGQLTAGVRVDAAGLPSQANSGTWLPVVGSFSDQNRMGWIDAGDVTLTSNCSSQPRVPESDTCESIAEDAIDELTAPSPSLPGLELLVARAEFAACQAEPVNTRISEGLRQFTSSDPSIEMRAILWAEMAFLESS